MPSILAVSGSPSPTSRTVSAVDHALTWLADRGHRTAHLAVRDLPAAELLAGVRNTVAVQEAFEAVANADGVIVATPVYKAAYTGLLKAFLDLLPENALAGKVVLPLATGGTVGHLLAIDYALRPVLTALGADHVLPGRFLLDIDIARSEAEGVFLAPQTEKRLVETLERFSGALDLRGIGFSAALPQAGTQTGPHTGSQADTATGDLILANGASAAVGR
ncbi:NADPH-dependent FMN reductase [Catenulispora rubra]|uniref:NADPH-dependent FMN reductase n=1 Tax=Catenulispora rubra TaxID=280293 RepID=UPI0018926445|nr:NADPH-dependent FMN reductase [Catenulispora rubra]